MSVVDLRSVDLNLLLVFTVLMQERSVTRSAAVLNVTQGAVSASLRRLRTLLDDPLFERRGRAMQPTAKALSIAPDIGRSLAGVAGVLFDTDDFDPRRSRRTFHVALSDDVEMVLLPWLLRTARAEGWRIRISLHQSNSKHWPQALEDGADAVICANPSSTQAKVRSQLLWTGGYSCVYDPSQIKLSEPPTLNEYLSLEHLLISYDAQRGFVDDLLEARGLERTVRVSVSHFAAAAAALRGAELIATMPAHAADQLARVAGLHVAAPPLATSTYSINLLWDVRRETDPAQLWLRSLIGRFADDVRREST